MSDSGVRCLSAVQAETDATSLLFGVMAAMAGQPSSGIIHPANSGKYSARPRMHGMAAPGDVAPSESPRHICWSMRLR